jgi:hypothetical protein
MPNYTVMPLDQQVPILEQEDKNYRLRAAKSQMWAQAQQELTDADKSLGTETDKLESAWTDSGGDAFVAKARDTQRVVRQWVHNIAEANPGAKLDQINVLVAQALPLAKANQDQFNKYMALSGGMALNEGYTKEQLEGPFREPSGKLMNQIADLYEQAGASVQTAGSGPKYRGVMDTPQARQPVGGGNPPAAAVNAPVGGGGPNGAVAGGNPTGGGAAPVGKVNGGSPTGGGPSGAPQTNPGGQPQTNPNGVQPTPIVENPVGAVGGSPTGGGDAPTGVNPISGSGDQAPTLSGGLGTAPTPTVTNPIGGGTGTGLPTGGTGGTPIVSPIGGGTNGTSGGGAGGTGIGPIGGGTGGGGGGGGGGITTPTPITNIPPGLGGGSGSSGSGNGQGGGGLNGGGSGAGVKLPGVSLGGSTGGGAAGIEPVTGGGAGGISPVGGGGVGGGSGISPVGGGVGGGSVGGLGGSSQIPSAATPVQAPSAAGPSGAAPAVPPPAGAATTASSGSGMGGMPMMPPMGAGGMGGGGTPGAGTASRPTSSGRNRRKEVVTPGLPVMLSGKAGMADMNAFTGRGRKQAAESDVPTTVQLIDEDLWQVEQKPAAEERVVAPAPVHRAH